MVSDSLTDRCYGFLVPHERPMLIVCPTCATAYQIQLAALGAGRSVRCSHCKNTWFAIADSMVEETEIFSVSAAERDPAEPKRPADYVASRTDEVIPPPPT